MSRTPCLGSSASAGRADAARTGDAVGAAAPPTTTITITSTGVSPDGVDIDLGARVLFVNRDTRAHDMGSDPHPDHTDCPGINHAGFLLRARSRETGNLVVIRTAVSTTTR